MFSRSALNGQDLSTFMTGKTSIKSDKDMWIESTKDKMSIKSKGDMLVKATKDITMKGKKIGQN